MQLHLFIHLSRKRAKTTVLLDAGVTENFINMQYAKEMCFPIKRLQWPQPVYNIDGACNKNGEIEHYTDLEMQTGNRKTWLWFFLTDTGEQKVILGYPWFTAMQPKIDWARGWIDSSQLLLILHTKLATESWIGQCRHTPVGRRKQQKVPPWIQDPLYITQISMPATTGKKQTLVSKLAEVAGTKMGDRKIPAKADPGIKIGRSGWNKDGRQENPS